MPLPLLPAARVPRLICLGAAGLFAAEAVALGLRLASTTAPYDDAFITFRYARNWAEGAGFVYNPGEGHLGTTAPFFALVLGLLARFGGVDPLASANWVSAIALAIAAWFSLRLVQEEAGWLGGLAAGFGVALSPMLVSTWGGEWLPAIAAMSAAFWFARAEHATLMAAAGSLAVLLRSEAALGLALLLGYVIVSGHRERWRAMGLSIAIGLAWALVAWSVMGRVLPDTLAAKLAQAHSGMFMTLLPGFLQGVKQFVKADSFMLAVALLAWHGALVMIVGGTVSRLVLLWVAAHVAFFVVLKLPFYHWYLQPIAWLIPIAMGMGVESVRIFMRALIRPPRAARWAGTGIAIVLVALALVAEARSTRHWVRTKPDAREALYNEVGRWLSTSTPPTARVAYVEIGRIGYFSRRPILDQLGLVTPGLTDAVVRQDLDAAILLRQPEIYLHSPMFDWASSLPSEPWFHDVYEPLKAFEHADGTRLTAYRLRPGASMPPPAARDALPVILSTVTPELLAGQSAGQTFVGRRPGLTRVDVMLATFGRANSGSVEVRVERTAPYGVVHREVVDVGTIVNNGWHAVRFVPQSDSEGQRYRLVVTSLDGRPANAIAVWYGRRGDRLGDDPREHNGAPAEGSLGLRLSYRTIPNASTSARSTAS